MKLDRAVIMGRRDLYMLDSAELGPCAWMASPSCETDLTIAPIVCWKWGRVNQTTRGNMCFARFLVVALQHPATRLPLLSASTFSWSCPRTPVPSPVVPVHAFESDDPQISRFSSIPRARPWQGTGLRRGTPDHIWVSYFLPGPVYVTS